MIAWLDLTVGDDPHPRRFDSPAAAREYLRRVERVGDEAIEALLLSGEVGPPLARRPMRLRPLTP